MRSPVGPGPIVIVDDPGAGACATIAAAQSLGRGYVPLSANHPATRIQQIFTAVEPALIVQSDQKASRMADILWYGPATNSSSSPEPLFNTVGTRGFDVLPNLANGQELLSAYMQGNTAPPISAEKYARLVHASYTLHEPRITPLPDAGLPRYALRNAPPTPRVRWPFANSALSSLYLVVQQLANVLSAIGALLMVLRRKFSVITWQVGLLAFAAVLMLAVIKLSATPADLYNWERALLQAQMVLAGTLCFPMQLLDSRRKWHHDSILAIAVAFFTAILICTSGLADVALGGGRRSEE